MLLWQQYHNLSSPPKQLLGHLHRRQHRILRRQLTNLRLGSIKLRPTHDVERLILSNDITDSVPCSHGHHVPELRERDFAQPRPQRKLHVRRQHEHRPVRVHRAGSEPSVLWPRVRKPMSRRQRAE